MPSPKKNFVIIYSGREGSSAIVSALSGQKGVNVPLFEGLDAHQFERTNTRHDYPEALDNVFTTGAFSELDQDNEKLARPAVGDDVLTTGFKWRARGDLRKAAKVFLKHNVSIFLLLRRDFLSLTCSTYVHNYGNKLQSDIKLSPHPQFTGSRPDAEVQREFERINRQDFKMAKILFLKSASDVLRTRNDQVDKARRFARAGVPVHLIYYEDFDENREAFITSFLAHIDLDIRASYSPFCAFKKVHTTPLAERIKGIDRMKNFFLFRHFERQYHNAVKEIEKYTQP